MTFAGDCPFCGKSLGADPEVRARGRCDRCEIARLLGAINAACDAVSEIADALHIGNDDKRFLAAFKRLIDAREGR